MLWSEVSTEPFEVSTEPFDRKDTGKPDNMRHVLQRTGCFGTKSQDFTKSK